MGRFYRTTNANPLDYMYSINTPLMERALMTNDKAITDNIGLAEKLGELSHYNHLQGDTEDATAITNSYMKQVNEITEAIKKDPANYKKQLEPIRAIKNKLREDYTTGTISKQVANYNKRVADFAAIDKQVELYHTSGGTKGVSPTRALYKKQYIDSQFDKTGYNPETKEYNIYQGGIAMDDIDIRKRLDDIAKEVKADENTSVKEQLIAGGAYFDKVTQKWEGIKPEKLLQVVATAAQSDRQLQEYLAHDKQMGYIPEDVDINPYSAFSVDKIAISKEEQDEIDAYQAKIDEIKDPKTKEVMKNSLDKHKKQLENREQLKWNPNNYLSPIMQSIVNTRAYSKTTQENDLSNNSLFNTRLNIAAANARDAANRNQRASQFERSHAERQRQFDITQENINKRFKEAQEARQAAAEAKAAGSGVKSPSGKKTTTTKEEKLPDESSVGKAGTNSFGAMMTKDRNGQPVKLFSNAGLSGEVDNTKKELGKVEEELKTLNSQISNIKGNSVFKSTLEVKKEKLEAQKKQMEGHLNDVRTWYAASTDAAKLDLNESELQIYNEYSPSEGVKILTKEIQELEKKNPKVFVRMTNRNQDKVYEDALIVAVAKRKLERYIKTKKKVDDGREAFLKGIREKDFIDEDSIKVGAKDNEGLGDLIIRTSRGAQLFDNNGESTAGIEIDAKGISWFAPKDDNYNLTFADNSLQNYIERSGTEIKVMNIAPTTALGNGNAIVEVQFADPTGVLPKGESYYINASPEMQKALSTKFKQNKNPEIVNIANSLDDDLANSVRKQLAKPKIYGQDHKFVITIPNNSNEPVPLDVTRVDGHLFVTYDTVDEKGNSTKKGFPSLSGREGAFNGPSELIESIKIFKTLQGSEAQRALQTGSLK